MKETSQRVDSNLWPHVFCSGDRVTQIQVQGLGLKGPLPQNFNQLSMLYNLGFQRNHFNGKLPSFRGLSELQFAFLDYNKFDTIPADFFDGLTSIRILALNDNPFNATTGWSIPDKFVRTTARAEADMPSSSHPARLPTFHASAQEPWHALIAYDACVRLCLHAWAGYMDAPMFLESECALLRNAFGLQQVLLQSEENYPLKF
ncbi:hypothetical protein PVL29_008870 [Vitis rotundifolia]|uniref:Uncharacterized protein n=1 Tax=Vitis rotundifolia TaxID=103349 RepID=A0AA38ZZ01_VITRO|nr:hypothetical protein PVL29_008870 [Vitis rotundifolia]